MKRYLVFIGENYYPERGMGDFEADFDNKEDCFKYIYDNLDYEEDCLLIQFCYIYDIVDKECVYENTNLDNFYNEFKYIYND